MRRILFAYILSISATVVWVHAFAEETPPAPVAIEEPAAEAPPAVTTDAALEAPQPEKEAPSTEPVPTPEPAPTPAPAAEAPTATEGPAATAVAEESVIPDAPALPEDGPVAVAAPVPETKPATPEKPAPKDEPAPKPAEPKAEVPSPTPPVTTPEQAPAANPSTATPPATATVDTNVVETTPTVPASCDANSIRIPDLTGEWCGSWNSCTNGHNGPMRATFCRLCNGDYQVTFCGRFCKIIPFRYTTVLKTTGYSDGVVYLSGSQSLGPIFGTFSYNAWANDRTFASGYRASKDQGEFHLSR